MKMIIGYARVSTVGQDYETQREKLEAAGCKKIFFEKVTGTSTAQRSQIKATKGNNGTCKRRRYSSCN